MELGTRAVKTGKIAIKTSKGNIEYHDRIEIKGNPKQYVDALLHDRVYNKHDLYVFLGGMARWETGVHPFVPGQKMGSKAFWRNAYAYLTKQITKE